MKKLLFLLLLVVCCSCVVLQTTEKDFAYKYVELPNLNYIKEGTSNVMYLPCDTIVELPSRRTFVVLAVRLRGDSTWIYCK